MKKNEGKILRGVLIAFSVFVLSWTTIYVGVGSKSVLFSPSLAHAYGYNQFSLDKDDIVDPAQNFSGEPPFVDPDPDATLPEDLK